MYYIKLPMFINYNITKQEYVYNCVCTKYKCNKVYKAVECYDFNRFVII